MPSVPHLGITRKGVVVISEQTVGTSCPTTPGEGGPSDPLHMGRQKYSITLKHMGSFNVTTEKGRARTYPIRCWAGKGAPRAPLWSAAKECGWQNWTVSSTHNG